MAGTGIYECHSSAPEEYQRRRNEALAGLNGVEVIADDILYYGSGENIEDSLKDHDSNLQNLLQHADEVKQEVEVEAIPSHLHGPFVHI